VAYSEVYGEPYLEERWSFILVDNMLLICIHRCRLERLTTLPVQPGSVYRSANRASGAGRGAALHNKLMMGTSASLYLVMALGTVSRRGEKPYFWPTF
jgi:hypothetical protein